MEGGVEYFTRYLEYCIPIYNKLCMWLKEIRYTRELYSNIKLQITVL